MVGQSSASSTAQTVFDVRNVTDCVGMCREIYGAYLSALAGNQTIEVRFNERWVKYAKADVPALLNLYLTMFNQCRGAAAAGLPNLNPGLAVKRGAPARGYWNFPRL